MTSRIKRWTAILLLALAGASASVTACAMACTGELAAQANVMIGDCHSPVPATGDCPLAQLCDVVASPVLVLAAATPAALQPAYVAPLTLSRPYRRDADPPIKPPAA